MTIELRETDTGRRVSVRVAERATVRLPETPTTGFRWVAEYDDTRLSLVEDSFDGAATPRGAGGERVLVFEALRSGTATLDLRKQRAWGGGEPTATFAVELEVLDPAGGRPVRPT